jgi:uncharacterized membrane protein
VPSDTPSTADSDGCGERLFVLRPHNGLYWRTTVWAYVGVCAVALLIAVGFVAIGLWPVLPFAGIELTALGVALYVTARRGRYREVVRVTDSRVFVEKGFDRPVHCWEFQRAWCEVVLNPSRSRLYPARLELSSAGVRVELGAFLTDEDRTRVACELRDTIGPMGVGTRH